MGEGIEMGHSDDEESSSDEDDKKAEQVETVWMTFIEIFEALQSQRFWRRALTLYLSLWWLISPQNLSVRELKFFNIF
jgi:hypothetical protein